MKYLLFGGASNVGKTEAITRLLAWLNGKGFVPRPPRRKNFAMYLDGTNLAGQPIRIIVSTAADDLKTIQDLKTTCDQSAPYDFIISAIRKEDDEERTNFKSIMGIISTDYVQEIAMVRIAGSLGWYQQAVDDFAHALLGNPPFSI